MSSSPPAPPPSSRSNNWLSTLVLALAAALGVPTAIIGVSTHFVNEHPWLSLAITLVFAIIVFIVYLIVKVWQKLESRLIDSIAEAVQSIFSGYHKHYHKYLGYQHRDFDVKGLSLQGPFGLELDQVFIELSIDTTMPRQMPTNPIPQELRQGSHTIWDFLASAPLAKQNLVIVGPPGSGKTTLLKHITLSLLASRKRLNGRVRVPRKLPVLLFLRDHASAIHTSATKDKPDFTLVEALHDHLKRWEQPDPPAGWVKRQLDNGRCLVLLDGLDEVADTQVRKEVANWVQTQIAAFRENRFIVTSRPFGFRYNPLSGVAMLEVRPFTPAQVESFIHKWYFANEIMSKQKDDEGVRMRARADAKGLLQQLYNNPTLLALTVNPLLLTMIAIVHRYGGGGKLPEKRVSLYADICKVFLGKRQEAKGQQLELKPEQMQLVLEPLAFYMMQSGIRDITPAQAHPIIKEPLELVDAQITVADFLKLVENVSGLLLERENGLYSFAHLTFQEYLTAIYLDKKQLGNGLTRYVKESWWRETILLYCAMADATPIIEACLADSSPSIPALVLAFDCQKDALTLQPGVKARLDNILIQGMEDTDPQRQHIAAEVLLTRRLRQMVYLKENTFIDTSLITCAEYQLFLDEQRVQGKYYQPDHWQNYRFSLGQGHTPVLGIRSSDAAAFCAWLTGRETDSWHFRLPTSSELQQIGDESILNSFPAGAGYWSNTGFVWLKEPLFLPHKVIQVFIDRALDRARARARV
jgi:energy-coupling factor transporter ATP-binding protein EcfA2